MKHKQIIDLSVPLFATPPDSMLKVDIEYVSHEQGAEVFGSFFGLDKSDFPEGRFAASENVTLTTHSGTHLDATWHFGPTSEGKPSRTIDQVPLEWCFSDGVVLDFRGKKAGEEIDTADVIQALEKIEYKLKPLDIVLIMTGVASRYYGDPNYTKLHPGVTREATLWMIDQGIKIMGIDAWGWDKPFDVMIQELRQGRKGGLWAAHYAGKEKEYFHLENLTNLEQIPTPFGFQVAVFPVRVEKASASWVRAVAILA